LPKAKSKWEGEDKDDDGPVVSLCLSSVAVILHILLQSDWEASSEEEEPVPAVAPEPPKKKGTLKAKLAEKEAQKAAQRETEEDDTDYDSDEVLDPREKAKQDRERELNADLHNAAELFGAAALGGTSTRMLPKPQ